MTSRHFDESVFDHKPVSIIALRIIRNHKSDVKMIMKAVEAHYKIKVLRLSGTVRFIEAYMEFCNLEYRNHFIYPSVHNLEKFLSWMDSDA